MKYSLNFYLRGGDKHRNIKPIYLFVSIAGSKIKLATGESITEDEWNARKQEVRNKSPKARLINPKLFELKSKVKGILDHDETPPKITGKYIRGKLKPIKNEKAPEQLKSLISLYDLFLSQLQIKVEAEKISYGYLQNQKAFRMHLGKFLKGSKLSSEFDIKDVNPAFAEDLKLYFIKLSFSANTIDKHFRSFKRFLRWSKTREYIKDIDTSHPGFKTKPERVDHPALSEIELNRIKALDLSRNPRLERVKDQFIFLCEQGLRFSDMQNLGTKDVKTDKDESGEEITYIEYHTQKTKEHVIAPLSGIGEDLIDAYYKPSSEKVFPSITNQKFNSYLKEVAKLAEIDKDISSHTGRRTFITLCIERGLDLESIVIHTGHRSMDELFRYWKKSKAHRLKKGKLLK